MGQKHIIELNGHQYDALTGKIVTNQSKKSNVHASPIKHAGGARSMDVMARPAQGIRPSTAANRRQIEKSQTLMRKTVKKPTPNKLHAVATVLSHKPVIKHQSSPAVISNKPTQKHELIRRFSPASTEGFGGGSSTKTSVAKHSRTPSTTAQVSLSHTALKNAASVVISPLDQAIAQASSHKQPKLKRPKLHARLGSKFNVSPRLINAGAASLAIVLIAGFTAYQNIPNLKMRLASSRAGLSGTLPAYQPPGFSLSDITYKTGQINISFRSNSDSRNFTVTQAASSWNSDTLREKLKSTGQISMPVEVPDKGKTLFIYNDSNVTWVDGGVLYRIEGESKLNSDQLMNLANSM